MFVEYYHADPVENVEDEEVRALGGSIGWSVNWALNYFISEAFPVFDAYLSNRLGSQVASIGVATGMFLATGLARVVILLWLPETRSVA